MATRKPATKWDVPPVRGQYDHLLQDIRDEVARQTPPPPPTPPQDPPRPPRVHVAIELVQRQSPTRSRRGLWGAAIMVWLVVIVIGVMLLLSGCTAAHADDSAFHYGHWQDTNGWHGETRQQGRTTDWTSYGPHGEQKHCHQYFVGDQPQTNCH